MDATNNSTPITSIIDCFSDLEDPRVEGRTKHKLIDIIVITICAVICGANNWKAIAAFAHAKQTWLESFLELPNGIPSHKTIGRVFSILPAIINPWYLKIPRRSMTIMAEWKKEFIQYYHSCIYLGLKKYGMDYKHLLK